MLSLVRRSRGPLSQQGARAMSLSLAEKKEQSERDAAMLDDVLIVGGGIVGSALACSLKSNPLFKGKKVSIIETQPPRKVEGDDLGLPDLRVYSITPASKKLLEAAGVWSKMSDKHVAPFKDMQVWDAMGDGFVRFDAAKAGVKDQNLGYIIEHGVLQRALMARMEELAAAEADDQPLRIHTPAIVRNFLKGNEVCRYSTVHLESGEELRGRLVVAADGGQSLVRTLAGLGTWGWSYDQQALVATIKTEQPHATAFQRFFPTGPLALLPLRDGYTSIVWSCTEDLADELMAMNPEEFQAALNDALFRPSAPPAIPDVPVLKDLLTGLHNAAQTVMAAGALSDPFVAPPRVTEVVGKRFAFPLKLQHATRYTRDCVALVGDSAHSMHPLAGQGLNMGLADVASLSSLLEEGVKTGTNISSPTFLDLYEKDRKAANVTMSLAMDGFKRLFGPTPDAVGAARNLGMGALNAIEPVKTQIIRYAMGL
ncbi:ubiquinone biosynthesis monooxygenase [Achlya hypogyna]|uniref:Ubiquinone biosynthesis monooxygenase COQ6, mitochondrial n=1 Tax=Achlya hypogyna TaxID=1202772 RepID=A0A1V9ZJC4_ACHHY|nr:ubiquinone biosynthesis monooxygenase [Achlya hypogyna]